MNTLFRWIRFNKDENLKCRIHNYIQLNPYIGIVFLSLHIYDLAHYEIESIQMYANCELTKCDMLLAYERVIRNSMSL